MVSVIVPVYNCEKYLEKCINSLRRQSYTELEIIIIDDGSKDNTWDICSKLSKEDDRIQIIQQENQGVSCARNQGIKIAKGEYIAFVDGDDWVEQNYIECLLNSLLNEQADMSVCGLSHDNLKGDVLKADKYQYSILDKKAALYSALNMDGFQGYLCNKMFCKNLIEEENLKLDREITILEDLLFVVNYLIKVNKVVVDMQPVYHYIKHDDSARQSCSKSKEFNLKWLTEIKALSQIVEILDDKELKNYVKSRKALSCGFYLKRMYECEYSNKNLEKN